MHTCLLHIYTFFHVEKNETNVKKCYQPWLHSIVLSFTLFSSFLISRKSRKNKRKKKKDWKHVFGNCRALLTLEQVDTLQPAL